MDESLTDTQMSMQNMREINCQHCNGKVSLGDTNCPHCGIPLPPDLSDKRRKHFVLWFIALAIFSAIMVFFLPHFG